MSIVRPANLALKFLLEVCALASFATFGINLDVGVSSVLVALALVGLGALLWGIWAAPKSPRRLPTRARIPFELVFFALAVAALLAVELRTLAAIFGVAVVVNAGLLSVFDDWGK